MSPVCGQLLMTHHELQIVDNHMTNVIHVDCMLHCVYYSPGKRKRQRIQESVTSNLQTMAVRKLRCESVLPPSYSLKAPGLGISPDALLPMKSHEIKGQVLKAVGPLVIFVQLLFQSPHSELCQHDPG